MCGEWPCCCGEWPCEEKKSSRRPCALTPCAAAGAAAVVEACTGIPTVPLSWRRSNTNVSIERPNASAVVIRICARF